MLLTASEFGSRFLVMLRNVKVEPQALVSIESKFAISLLAQSPLVIMVLDSDGAIRPDTEVVLSVESFSYTVHIGI